MTLRSAARAHGVRVLHSLIRAWNDAPLAFYAGVLVGVLTALLVFAGAMAFWGVWIIRNTHGA